MAFVRAAEEAGHGFEALQRLLLIGLWLVEGDPTAADEARALLRLSAALHDYRQGAHPALLNDRKRTRNPADLSISAARAELMVCFAMMLSALCGDRKATQAEIDQTARKLSYEMRLAGLASISAGTLKNWRRKAGRDEPKLTTEMTEKLQNRPRGLTSETAILRVRASLRGIKDAGLLAPCTLDAGRECTDLD